MKYNKKAELLMGLWNYCKNNCKFCYNQGLFHLPLDVNTYLDTCNYLLNSTFIEDFEYLRFLGGELFDGSIDQLKVRDKFLKIMQTSLYLLENKQLEKINFLTNLIYDDNKDLKNTLEIFESRGLIDKIELSTSYDIVGRFNRPNSEKWWWNNIKWINEAYPNMQIYIGIIMTQPFITTVTKEWLDDFCIKIKNCHPYFIELDIAAELGKTKQNSPFADLFPKRADFLKFLKNLKEWGYYDLIMKADGSDAWSEVTAIQMGYVEEFSFPVFKNQQFLLQERAEFREDGYIDSDIPLFDDVKKMRRL